MLTLRPYQTDLVAQTRATLRQGCRRLLLTSPTGSGKTCLVAHLLAGAAAKGKRAWFIVHRKELLDQSVRTFVDAADLHVGILAAGYPSDASAPVQVCAIGSLKRRLAKVPAPDLVVFDECFVAGTLIGERRIEDIGLLSQVPCIDGNDRVIREFMKHAPDRLYRLTSGERSIVCTGNHPFLAKRGWVNAAALVQGRDHIYGVRRLRRTKESEGASSVFDVLPSKDGRTKQAHRARADANAQSDAFSRKQREGIGYAQGDGPQAFRSWREWSTIARGCASVIRCSWLALRSRGKNWRETSQGRALNKLQIRHRFRAHEDRHRSGRVVAWSPVASGRGPKKRTIFEWLRVDRIEILQRGSDGEFERVCPDGRVYNLETERTHTYIANGFVVHNCHHLPSASWSAIAAALPRAVQIGLTATPARLDGRGLRPYFDALVSGPSTADLIAQGYLSPYRLFAPAQFDASQLHKVAGDFNKAEVSSAMAVSTVVGDAVGTYQRHAAGGRALVFAWSIAASEAIAGAFTAASIAAAHVDGETPAVERADAMRRFRAGELRVLCNVDLFGEGLDVPSVDAVFLLRPTASLGLYLQQCGRGLRPAEGKPAVRIFDHVGNYERHGLPDDAREWTLDGITKAPRDSLAPMKRCPVCFAVAGATAKTCPHCGAAYPVKSRKVQQIAGELAETELSALRGQLPELARDCRTLQDWQDLAKRLGYKAGWAFFRWSHAAAHRDWKNNRNKVLTT